MKINKIIVILGLAFFSFSFLHAQSYRFLNTEIFAVNAFAGYTFNQYSASFNEFQGSISCNDFTSGKGNGLAFGAQFELPIHSSGILSVGLHNSDRSGELITNSTFPVRDIPNNQIINVITDNTIKTTISTLDFQVDYRQHIVESYALIIRTYGGLRFSIPLTAQFTQSEAISSPNNVTFVNGYQNRTIAEGKISSINSLVLSSVIGLEPMVRISPIMHIVPSVSYEIPLSNLTSDADWKSGGLKLGLGLRYSFRTYAPSPNMP